MIDYGHNAAVLCHFHVPGKICYKPNSSHTLCGSHSYMLQLQVPFACTVVIVVFSYTTSSDIFIFFQERSERIGCFVSSQK